jgi:hypothetical protein
MQERIYPLFGYYPWKCARCKMLQFKRMRREEIVTRRGSKTE